MIILDVINNSLVLVGKIEVNRYFPVLMHPNRFYEFNHLENGIYFATTANGSSACGSATLILAAPQATTFTLTYSGSGAARDGEINLTFLKLSRTVQPGHEMSGIECRA